MNFISSVFPVFLKNISEPFLAKLAEKVFTNRLNIFHLYIEKLKLLAQPRKEVS